MVGTVAGGALVLVRARQQQRRRHANRLQELQRRFGR
jgi:hypothetical protein